MAGWLLGRDELLKVGAECDKKILILTDWHLNQGIVEPDKVEALDPERIRQRWNPDELSRVRRLLQRGNPAGHEQSGERAAARRRFGREIPNHPPT